MTKITDAILPVGHSARPGGRFEKTSVTIHETGNPNKGAGAFNHSMYARNRTDKVSCHYYVDDKSIYRTIPDDEPANHSGNPVGNRHSIGIEICVNSDSDFAIACNNAADLAAMLMRERGLYTDNLRQHYDWNGKNCPAALRRSGWAEFVRSVQTKIDYKVESPMAWVKEFSPGSVEWIRPIRAKAGETCDALYARAGMDYLFNACAFTKTGVIDGPLTIDGVVIGSGRAGHGYAMRDGEWRWSYLNGVKWPHFLGGFGVLARNGQKDIINPHSGTSAYTAIGNKSDGTLVIAMSDNSAAALTTDQLAEHMLSLGCVNAVRMDGGGSVQGRGPDLDIRSARLVPVYLGIKMKMPDVNTPSPWAKDAVEWAVANKLIVGDADGDLKLQELVTMERLVTVLYRYHGKNG